ASPGGPDKIGQVLVKGVRDTLGGAALNVGAAIVPSGQEAPGDGAIPMLFDGHAINVVVDAGITLAHGDHAIFGVLGRAHHAQVRHQGGIFARAQRLRQSIFYVTGLTLEADADTWNPRDRTVHRADGRPVDQGIVQLVASDVAGRGWRNEGRAR